jgi:hypothetical protein
MTFHGLQGFRNRSELDRPKPTKLPSQPFAPLQGPHPRAAARTVPDLAASPGVPIPTALAQETGAIMYQLPSLVRPAACEVSHPLRDNYPSPTPRTAERPQHSWDSPFRALLSATSRDTSRHPYALSPLTPFSAVQYEYQTTRKGPRPQGLAPDTEPVSLPPTTSDQQPDPVPSWASRPSSAFPLATAGSLPP